MGNQQRNELFECLDHLADDSWDVYKKAVDIIKNLKIVPYVQVSLETNNEQRLTVSFHDWHTDKAIRKVVLQQNDDIHHAQSVLALIEVIPTFIHKGFSTEMSKVGIHILLTPQQQVLSMYEVK